MIALTETWLNNSVKDGELFNLSEFQVFRSDFLSVNRKKVGGVFLGVKAELRATKLNNNIICDNFSEIPGIDILFVKVLFHYKPLYLCVTYIPPCCDIRNL